MLPVDVNVLKSEKGVRESTCTPGKSDTYLHTKRGNNKHSPSLLEIAIEFVLSSVCEMKWFFEQTTGAYIVQV